MSVHTFVSTSGNTCKLTVEESRNGRLVRTGVSAVWKFKPTEQDRVEVEAFVLKVAVKPGEEVAEFVSDRDGLSLKNGGKERQVDSIKRFLETGDPGVPVKRRI